MHSFTKVPIGSSGEDLESTIIIQLVLNDEFRYTVPITGGRVNVLSYLWKYCYVFGARLSLYITNRLNVCNLKRIVLSQTADFIFRQLYFRNITKMRQRQNTDGNYDAAVAKFIGKSQLWPG